MRLIDADKLIVEGYSLERTYRKDSSTMVLERRKIEDVPVVDAVEVVRCKDCMVLQWCRFAQGLGLDGFCSQGERREDDNM